MSYDLEEQEKIEALKAWWAKWGNTILASITVVMLAIASWQWWNWHQRNQATQAAGVFEALQSAIQRDQVSQVLDASTRLQDQYGRTAYAPRGALLAAAALYESGDLAAARERLQWVMDRNDPALSPVARLRLAALLIDDQQAETALNLVSGAAPEGFAALYADRRGDALLALGRIDAARDAWAEAEQGMPPGDPLRSVLRLKLDALGGQSSGGPV